VNNILTPLPPGTYSKQYDCKIRDVDWKLLSFIIRAKSQNLTSASYSLGLPESTLKSSQDYLKGLGVLPWFP